MVHPLRQQSYISLAYKSLVSWNPDSTKLYLCGIYTQIYLLIQAIKIYLSYSYFND